MKELYNLLLFIAICFIIFILFRSFNYNPMLIEGMTDGSGNWGKYRSDYETAILNLDDLISNLMLQTALNVDQTNPSPAINKLAQMQQAKTALNSVMKFVDSQ